MRNVPAAAPPQPGRNLDRYIHAQLARLTTGLSVPALLLAFEDWWIHLMYNPAQLTALAQKSAALYTKLQDYLWRAQHSTCDRCIEPMMQDHRFIDPAWQNWPFNVINQYFLLTEKFWHEATTGVRGVSCHHEQVVNFAIRQLLDIVSPANFVMTNPEVLARTVEKCGANLWRGAKNFAEDLLRQLAQTAPPETQTYQVGQNLATTPGKVIFRNELIELIQYAPASDKVRPEPILIIPAWIMKYYILDLSPENSLIKYLVDQGHTVFTVSWVNPGSANRDFGMDDYLQRGVMEAIDTVTQIIPDQKMHAVGYCLGGTLLAIAAAAMGRDDDGRLASISLLAAQTDFTEPGELALFIDESQIAYLEDIMWDRGYLDNSQMAGAFQMMNSVDLVWSRMLKEYLMGDRSPMSDLMAWNADGTRLPYRMHSEYLRRLFLHNDLASGRYPVGDSPVALTDIQCPIFCVGALRDHVAPWHSVFKLQLLADVEITFLLTSGGHNVGIVNPPGVSGRSYRMLTRPRDGRYLDPETWFEAAPPSDGSWWIAWANWLQARSGKSVSPPPMGASDKGIISLCAAPGTYVLQK